MPTLEPKYKHDCKECVFLGTVPDPQANFCDLYAHWIEKQRTVIARYGNEPHQYLSGIPMISYYPALKEALTRAINLGIVPKNVAYPLVIRRAFRDNLAEIENFNREALQRLSDCFHRGIQVTKDACLQAEQLIKDLWKFYYQQERVETDSIPEFRIFSQANVLKFEWKDPHYGPFI
jgi:hypothetical protein